MVKTGMRRMKIHTGHVRQQRPRRRYGERNDGISVHGDPVERGAEQGCPERVPGGVRRAQADIQQKILRTHGPSVRIGRFGVQMVKDRAAIRGDGPAVPPAGDGPKSFRMQSHQGNPHIVNGGIVEKILAAGAESPQGAGERRIDPQPDLAALHGAGAPRSPVPPCPYAIPGRRASFPAEAREYGPPPPASS